MSQEPMSDPVAPKVEAACEGTVETPAAFPPSHEERATNHLGQALVAMQDSIRLKGGRQKSLVITKIEEALLWLTKI